MHLMIIALFLTVSAASTPGIAAELEIYEVEKAEGKEFILDLGDDDPKPKEPALKTAMIVGSKAAAEASLQKLDKACEMLCGPEDELTCHHVGRYGSAVSAKDLGSDLLALAAKHEIKDIGPAPEEKAGTKALDKIKEWAKADYQRAQSGDPMEYRWKVGADGKAQLHSRFQDPSDPKEYFDNPIQDYSLDNCQSHQVGTFARLTCDDYAWLYEGTKLIIVSNPDGYGVAKIEFLTSFVADGEKYVAVRIGVKGSDKVGLLFRSKSGWKLIIPKITPYPKLC